MPYHLLFPLLSSILFVFGMMFAKRAISRGANPWTSTFYSNLWLALSWGAFGAFQTQNLPAEAWWQAALIGFIFFAGQLFTYLAFQHGDVSVATPVFGVKVIIVAVLLSLLADEVVGFRVWVGAVLATVGIGVIQTGARTSSSSLTARRAGLTILLAMTSAVCLSLFDIGLQTWGRRWGVSTFVPAVFAFTGLFSCSLLPWIDSPRRLRTLGIITPLLAGTVLMAVQAMSMSYSLSRFGDATRINIVYALRGLWAVGLAWLLARAFGGAEARHSTSVMLLRLGGAVLLMLSILVALSQQ